jgi:copper chaperone CopZ
VARRALVPLALLVFASLALGACGGGSGDADKITEAIETAATSADPSNCAALETQRFDEQNSQQKGKAAVKTCEAEAEKGETQADAVNVSSVSVDGEKATAEVEFEGGPLNSQVLEFALVETEGAWKLDQIEGFAKYDGKALAKIFEGQFEAEPKGPSPAQASCFTGKIAAASKAEAEELFLGGSPGPIEELAEGCA